MEIDIKEEWRSPKKNESMIDTVEYGYEKRAT